MLLGRKLYRVVRSYTYYVDAPAGTPESELQQDPPDFFNHAEDMEYEVEEVTPVVEVTDWDDFDLVYHKEGYGFPDVSLGQWKEELGKRQQAKDFEDRQQKLPV